MNALMFRIPHQAVTAGKVESFMYGNESSGPNKYITCPHCGEQILMVPALSDMIQAIEDHLSTHKEGSFPRESAEKRVDGSSHSSKREHSKKD